MSDTILQLSYIILFLIGIVATILMKSTWSKRKQIFFIFSSLIFGLLLFYGIGYILEYFGAIKKSGFSFFARIPWLDIILFFCMIAGMAAKYFYDTIGSGNKLVFKKWQLFKPMLISPIVFGTIYRSTDTSTSVILLLIFAFQNGFFWQTVLNKSTR